MTRLAEGDREAFVPVFELLWPALRRFAEGLLREPALAEDAAQAVLIKVFSRAVEFDGERDAMAWALGIAAFECRTLRRRAERRREEGLAAEPTAPGHEEQTLLRAALLDVLGTLRPGDAETVAALVRGERPPGATYRKRLERALSRLRAAWRARHGAD